MLNFILGRNNSGKTEKIRTLIAERASENKKCILIVPEQFSFESERSILEKIGAQKMLNVDILSFTRLAFVINEQYGKALNKTIDDGTRKVMMSLSLEALSGKLEYFKKFSSKPALLSTLLTFVTELKQCAVSPDEIAEVSEKTENKSLGKKLSELALITATYDALVSRSFFDDENLLTVAADMISETDFFDGKAVYFDAFCGFTKQERNCIKSILPKAENVYISLCTDRDLSREGISVFENVNSEFSYLKECAAEQNVRVSQPEILNVKEDGRSPELVYLEKYLCGEESEPYKKECENIVVCAAGNMADEADFVACEIKKILRCDPALRCRNIAVIERTAGTYDKELIESFRKYGVPIFEDKRKPIGVQPVMVFVKCLLMLCAEGFSTENFMRLLKTGLTALSADEISELENYAFIWNIDGSKWRRDFTENPNGLGVDMTEKSQETLIRLNDIRKKSVLPILTFKKAFEDADGEKKSELIYDFLVKNGVTAKLREKTEYLISSGDTVLCEEQDTVWATLMDMLGKMASAIGKAVVTPKRYSELFDILLSAVTLGSLPQELDSVTVGAADRIRVSDCKVTFIIGADSGVFPLDPSTEGLLSDSERKIIGSLGVKLAETAEYKAVDEKFTAYRALTSPSEKLYVTYSLSNFDGGSMRPSEIVDNIVTAFPNVPKLDTALLDSLYPIESDASAFRALATGYRENTALIATLKKYFSGKNEYSSQIKSLDRLVSGEEIKIKDPKNAISLFGKSMYVSASRVETYYKCPFEYFCKYGLNAKPRKTAELDPAQSGTVIHFVLEHILSLYSKPKLIELSDNDIKTIVKNLLSEYLDETMGGKENKEQRFLYLYNRLSDSLFEVVKRIAEELKVSDFTPSGFEVKIDEDGEIPSYAVALPDGGFLKIRGSVDRVDTMEKNGKTYLRVIDYKSGGKTFLLSDVLSGLNMQMLIYLFALGENGKEKYGDVFPCGVLYMPAKKAADDLGRNAKSEEVLESKIKKSRLSGIVVNDKDAIEGMDRDVSGRFINVTCDKKNGGYKGDLLSLEELGKLKTEIDGILREMANSLKAGKIEVLPCESTNYRDVCAYCDYYAVCGFEQGAPVRKIEKMSLKDAKKALNEEGEDVG